MLLKTQSPLYSISERFGFTLEWRATHSIVSELFPCLHVQYKPLDPCAGFWIQPFLLSRSCIYQSEDQVRTAQGPGQELLIIWFLSCLVFYSPQSAYSKTRKEIEIGKQWVDLFIKQCDFYRIKLAFPSPLVSFLYISAVGFLMRALLDCRCLAVVWGLTLSVLSVARVSWHLSAH